MRKLSEQNRHENEKTIHMNEEKKTKWTHRINNFRGVTNHQTIAQFYIPSYNKFSGTFKHSFLFTRHLITK